MKIKKKLFNFNIVNPISFLILIIFVRVYAKAIYVFFDPNAMRWDLKEDTIVFSFLLLNIFLIFFIAGWWVGSKIKVSSHTKYIFYPRKTNYFIITVLLFSIFLEYMFLYKIIIGFGGLEKIFIYQAAIPSMLKELGLSPFYGLMVLFLIPQQIYIIYTLYKNILKYNKILLRTKIFLIFISIIAIIPFIIISRRSPILFFLLPILFFIHYRIHKTSNRKLILYGTLLGTIFILVSILRMGYFITKEFEGNFIQELFKSPEFSMFDALALVIQHKEDLKKLVSFDVVLDHPEYLTQYYLAALVMRELFDFKFKGGTIPPLLVGNLYLIGNIPIIELVSFLLGFLFSIVNKFFVKNNVLIFLSGYWALYMMQLVLNGDIVLITKVNMRYFIAAIFVIPLFFYIRVRRINNGSFNNHTHI